MALIEVKNLIKTYQTGEESFNALDGVSFSIDEGEFVAIMGTSGSGKSTCMNTLGTLDIPTSGEYRFEGIDVFSLSIDELSEIRNSKIGFVFQGFNLIPRTSALENVELAAQICKDPMDALEALDIVGLSHRVNNFPAQLSGGEQQRVAIARAIAKNPKILLCDEPTGALDYVTGKQILKILQDMARKKGITVVVITHNSAICPMADRVIHIRNGKADKIDENPHPTDIEDIEW